MAAVVLAAGIAAFVIWWVFFRGDSPPALDFEGQKEFIEETVTNEEADPSAPESSAPESDISDSNIPEPDVAGTWRVNTEIGSLNDGTSSFAGYRIREELFGIGTVDAYGRSPDISGTITITDSENGTFLLEQVLISVDLRSLQSDRPNRDGAVQNALDTDEFPFTEFSLTTPLSIPASALEEGLEAAIEGNLTVHGETLPVAIPIEAGLAADFILVTGTVQVKFDDFGISAPSAAIVASVSDTITIEIQCNFERVS